MVQYTSDMPPKASVAAICCIRVTVIFKSLSLVICTPATGKFKEPSLVLPVTGTYKCQSLEALWCRLPTCTSDRLNFARHWYLLAVTGLILPVANVMAAISHSAVVEVQTLMSTSMESRLRAYYQHRDPYLMLNALKGLFAPQVRMQKFDYLNKILTTKMEENTWIEIHLTNMHRLYRRLTDELKYEMTDDIRKDVVLQSLPPSYKAYVEGYWTAGFDVTFHQCLMQIKSLKGRANCWRDRRPISYIWYTVL
jgi:hypothetical protein